MAVFNNILAGASGQSTGGGPAVPADIERSLRINSTDSAYLKRTMSAGNQKKWTWSGWVKRATLSGSDLGIFGARGTSATFLRFKSNQLDFVVNGLTHRRTTAQFRDHSAWYHFVWSVDTTQTTPADRSRFYVNGTEVTAWNIDSALTLDQLTDVNAAGVHLIGATDTVPNDKLDAYIADFYLIDGQQLTADDFGAFDETTGAWNPIVYSGTFPGNSFHLDFADNSSTTSGSNVGIGKDTSGNGNYWDSINISVTAGAGNDSLFDSPTNGTQTDTGAGGEISGNYSCFNALAKNGATTLRNGNLDVESTGVYTTLSTIGFPSTGKFYAEFTINNTDSGYPFVGIGGLGDAGIESYSNPNTGAFYATGGYITGSVSVSGLTSLSAGNTVGVAFDASNGKTWFRLNGTWVNSGNPAAGTNQTCTLTADPRTLSWATSTYQNGTVTLNAGQRAFHSNAPSGFKCLCTANFDTPTIEDSSTAMDIRLWDVTSSETMNMSPDLIWMKRRNSTGNHAWVDTVRSRFQHLESDNTNLETRESTPYISSFNSDGFSLNSGTVFNNGNSFVGWCWEGGHPATAATGAIRLDGSGDYLATSASTDFQLGTSNFTIEAWVYYSETNGGDCPITMGDPTTTFAPLIAFMDGGYPRVYMSSNGTSWDMSAGTTWNAVKRGSWHHIALCRNGSTFYLAKDGYIENTFTSSASIYQNTNTLNFGRCQNANYFNGFISNIRFIKGTALYLSSYNVPTSPLTNVTNTKLLCAQSTTSATTAAVAPGTITANGDTVATSFNPLDRFSVNGTGYSTTGAAGITEGPIVKLTGASVNRNAGFSVVTYTSTSNNTTVGHGLTEKPALIIVRNRFNNYSWMVYSEALGATKYLILQATNAAATNIDRWNNTEPTSSVFTIGTNAQVNGDCVAYCFAPVDGFSAFGTYAANGLANGPFVCCNFRPKVVILKKTDTTENWIILDATRDSYNETVANLFPNRDLAEQASAKIDLLANGFKLRSTTTGGNTTGGTYLYAAFAENPFKYARAR